MFIVKTPAWMDEAQCAQVDPELFFPGPGDHAPSAKMICGGCPVKQECLTYGLENDLQGIWGGASALQRQKLRAGSQIQSA